MSSPGGHQPYPNDPYGQQGGYPPPPQDPTFPPPQSGSYPPPQSGGGYPPQDGGYPPPADGGYPPQPADGGFPPPPAGGSFPPQPAGGGFAPPRPTPRGGGAKRAIITIVVLLLVVGGIAAAGAYFGRNAASKAKVGDCVQQKGPNDLAVVKCSDAKADFKVVGRVENKTQIDAGINACKPFPEAEQAYWEGKQGEKGLVLCLAPAK